MGGVDTVELCLTKPLDTSYDQLMDQLDEKVSMVQKRINATHTDQKHLVDVAATSLPPYVKLEGSTARSKRAVVILTRAANAPGQVLGTPVKDAVYSALSISNNCKDNKDQGVHFDHVVATHKNFPAVYEKKTDKD